MKDQRQLKGKIILKPEKEKIFFQRHSWIFSGAIEKIENENLQNGDWVEVYSYNHQFLGNAFFEKKNQIVARIFDFDSHQITSFSEYWFRKLNLIFLRKQNLFLDSNAFRLIHSESDECPGIVCDIYNDFALIQIDYLYPKFLVDVLINFLKEKKIKYILQKKQKQYQWLTEPIESVTFCENQIQYKINSFEFQKTGFYLDQKTNRKKLQSYCKNKIVLDTFCYMGSFGMNALLKGAKKVTFLDSSKKALDQLKENLSLNHFNFHTVEIVQKDVFQSLQELQSGYFDIVILDPPAFVKNKKNLSNGIKGYIKLNTFALQKIKKQGILFTFSCSQYVTLEAFRKIIFLSAKEAKRKVMILEYLTQSIDHTINVFHPQGEYLKGLVLYVE